MCQCGQSERQLVGVSFLLPSLGSGDQTHIIRLDAWHPDLTSHLGHCPSQGFNCCDETMTQSMSGGTGCVWLQLPHCGPSRKDVRTRTQGKETWRQELMQRPWSGVALLVCSSQLAQSGFYRTQEHPPKESTTKIDQTLSYQSLIKKIPSSWIVQSYFLNFSSFFQINLAYVKLS